MVVTAGLWISNDLESKPNRQANYVPCYLIKAGCGILEPPVCAVGFGTSGEQAEYFEWQFLILSPSYSLINNLNRV